MSIATDEAAVRKYLRLVVGAPERTSDDLSTAARAFIRVAARWSSRNGVDRRTLALIGVPNAVLDDAGVTQPSVDEIVRPHYSRQPFDVATVVRRACVGEASVRRVIAQDEDTGLIERVDRPGRSAAWRRAKR